MTGPVPEAFRTAEVARAQERLHELADPRPARRPRETTRVAQAARHAVPRWLLHHA